MRNPFVLFVVLAAASAAFGQWLEGMIALPDSFSYLDSLGAVVENPQTGRVYIHSASGVMVVNGITGAKETNHRNYDDPVFCAGADRICLLRRDSVLVVDARADTVVARTGTTPGWDDFVFSQTSRRLYLFTTNSSPADIEVLDVTAGVVVDSVEYAGRLGGAIWDSLTNRVFFAACLQGESGIVAYDCALDSFVGGVWYERQETGFIALDQDLRKLFLSWDAGDTIVILNPDSIAEVSRVQVPGVDGFELVERRTHRLFYRHGSATVVFDTRADSVRAELADMEPAWLDWDRENGEVYLAPCRAAGVAVVDTNDAIDRWLLVERGDTIVTLALKRDGTTLYAGLEQDTLFIADPQTGAVRGMVVAPCLRLAGLLHNPAGNMLYAFCYNKGVIAAIDSDGQMVGCIEGIRFWDHLSAVVNPALNRLYVAGNYVLGVVDCNTMQVVHVESLPRLREAALVLRPDLGKLYVFPRIHEDTMGHVVRVFDCWTDSVVAEVGVWNKTPDAVYHQAAGLIYFSCRRAPAIGVFDPATNTVVRTVDPARADIDDRLCIDLNRNRVYYSAVRDECLIVIDAISSSVLDTVELPREVDTLIMNHARDKLYALQFSRSGHFYVYDCAAESLLPEVDFDPSYSALLNTRNDKLYFYDYRNGLRVIDCRYDTTTALWDIGQFVSFLAWDRIDNRVYAAWARPDIFVFKDDPTGVLSHSPTEPVADRLCPTIVRDVLWLGQSRDRPSAGGTVSHPMAPARTQSPALLDITGRKVMDLQPGPNDISRLAPGIYFVVTPHPYPRAFRPASPSPQAERETAVRRVLVAK
ncbi:MAG: hypothetical protein JSU73_10715 [candidate division WOR-3 bacterium]|nr:MAG: hypothetical protein JSU73_10715 [candidate division WOR-3 bacterium]